MAKEKVTLTLDSERLQTLRELAGARSLSSAVDQAVAAHLAKLRHLAAVDEWLHELEREHGPIPDASRAWASDVVDRWDRVRRAAPALGGAGNSPIDDAVA